METPEERAHREIAFKSHPTYTIQTWDYLSEKGFRSDPIRDAIEMDTYHHFKSVSMMITNRQECKLFEEMIQFANAKSVIEIGVFTGSSCLSLARGVGPNGKVLALDVSEEYTNIAKKHWEAAGVSDRIELILGPAAETLNKLLTQGKEETVDFIYIDADKPMYLEYYELSLRLLRHGGIIAIDNVLWGNEVGNPEATDQSTVIIREVNERAHTDPRVKNVILPIGDGVNVVRKI